MNTEFLNLLKSPRRDYSRKEKKRGDEPFWAVIRMYMEMSQGNSLCSYLKQKCLFFFFFQKQNRKAPVGGLAPVGGVRM
jgi:hypothetical protein